MTLTEEKFLRVEQERNRILEKILKIEEKKLDILKEMRNDAKFDSLSNKLKVLREDEKCLREESTSLT